MQQSTHHLTGSPLIFGLMQPTKKARCPFMSGRSVATAALLQRERCPLIQSTILSKRQGAKARKCMTKWLEPTTARRLKSIQERVRPHAQFIM